MVTYRPVMNVAKSLESTYALDPVMYMSAS